MEYPTNIQSFDLSAWDKRSFDSDARLNNNKPLNKIIQRPRSYFESVCVWGGGGGEGCWLVTQSGGAEKTFSQ